MRKRFRTPIREDFNLALVEPDSNISNQAKKLGLSYVGFNRYEDPNTGQTTHIAKDGQLVPMDMALKTNSYKKDNADDIGKLSQSMGTKTEELHRILSQAYTPDKFDNDQLDAIREFTADPSVINQMVSSMQIGAPLRVMPSYDGDNTYKIITGLDSATKKVKVPIDFEAYTSLSSDVDPSQFAVGSVFRFNTFRSLTLDPSMVLHSAPPNPGQTKMQTYVLQIEVKQGTPGLYAEDFSSSPEEYEFILARGVELEVTEAPNKIVGSNATFNINQHEVYYITCTTSPS